MPLISFEGIDRCGKDTQIDRVVDRMSKRGLPYLITRHPGGTAFGQKCRQLLLDSDSDICMEAEVFVFMADAAQNFKKNIKPVLDKGWYVIVNRCIDSPFAYQGYGRGVPFHLLRAGMHFAMGHVVPDLTILLDISPEESLKRKGSKEFEGGDRFESLDTEFHRKVRDGYLALAREHANRFRVIDALPSADLVTYKVFRVLEEAYPEMNEG